MEFLGWLESLSYSAWVRESPSLWAFPALLFVHTLGMSLVAGGAAVISLALLGLWPRTPLKPLERLYPVMWFGFAINLFTGVSIFLKDATIYGRNYDLYAKLVFVMPWPCRIRPLVGLPVFGTRVPMASDVLGPRNWPVCGCMA